MTPIDAGLLAEVRPECWYAAADLARMFGRSAETANDWLRPRGGRPPKLASAPDPVDPRRRVVSGRVILAMAGALLIDAAPVPVETDRGRQARGRKATNEIKKLIGGTR